VKNGNTTARYPADSSLFILSSWLYLSTLCGDRVVYGAKKIVLFRLFCFVFGYYQHFIGIRKKKNFVCGSYYYIIAFYHT
jgi:hypothetical protein